MVEIKEVYPTLDSQTLNEDITKNFNGHLQSMLLALVKGRRTPYVFRCY